MAKAASFFQRANIARDCDCRQTTREFGSTTKAYRKFLTKFSRRWDIHHGALVDGSHIKFFSKSTIPQLLSENGFRVMSFNGTGRLPYLSKSMILLSQKNS